MNSQAHANRRCIVRGGSIESCGEGGQASLERRTRGREAKEEKEEEEEEEEKDKELEEDDKCELEGSRVCFCQWCGLHIVALKAARELGEEGKVAHTQE